LAPYRAYDSAVARWLSRDPIGENGGLALYGYVGNNPINVIDALGLWTFEIYGGDGLAGYLSFGYNDSHFSWRVGIGVGGGLGGGLDRRNRERKADNLPPGAFEGGLLGRLDAGLPVMGVGVGAELTGAENRCGPGQATAKISGSATFLLKQKSGELAWQTDPQSGKWNRETDSSTPIPVPSLESMRGEFKPTRAGLGGFFGVVFGRQ
jgi:uncharacterized protein RhaS with RHS repeats